MGFVINMQDEGQREHFTHCQFIARLRLECKGIRFKGRPTSALAREYFNRDVKEGEKPVIWGRTKEAVLLTVERLYEEKYGRKYGAA